MWTHEHVVVTEAPAQAIWREYQRVGSWSEWDAGLAWSRLDGPFRPGSTAVTKDRIGPARRWTLETVLSNVGFSTRAQLPGCEVRVRHALRPVGPGTQVTHRIELSGPMSRVAAALIGRPYARRLPSAMARLCARASGDSRHAA